MKSVLTCMVLLMSVTSAIAQKIELGFNYGYYRNPGEQGSYMGDTKSLRGAYNFGKDKWQAGLSLTRFNIHEMTYIDYGMSPHGPGSSWIMPFENISRATAAEVFVNRQFHFGRVLLYTGLSGGYVGSFDGFAPSVLSAEGYIVGAQAGMTWYFLRWLGLNTNIETDFVQVTDQNRAIEGKINKIYLPITVGFRCRF